MARSRQGKHAAARGRANRIARTGPGPGRSGAARRAAQTAEAARRQLGREGSNAQARGRRDDHGSPDDNSAAGAVATASATPLREADGVPRRVRADHAARQPEYPWKSRAQALPSSRTPDITTASGAHLRQRSALSGIMNGRASNEPGLWDCGDLPEGSS